MKNCNSCGNMYRRYDGNQCKILDAEAAALRVAYDAGEKPIINSDTPGDSIRRWLSKNTERTTGSLEPWADGCPSWLPIPTHLISKRKVPL